MNSDEFQLSPKLSSSPYNTTDIRQSTLGSLIIFVCFNKKDFLSLNSSERIKTAFSGMELQTDNE